MNALEKLQSAKDDFSKGDFVNAEKKARQVHLHSTGHSYRGSDIRLKSSACYLLMCIYTSVDNYEKAEALLSLCKAYGLAKDSSFLSDCAVLYLRWKKYPIAEGYAQRALDEDNTNANAYFVMGTILDETGYHSDAILSYEKGLEFDYRPEILTNIGNAYEHLGSRDSAKAYHHRAIEETTDNARRPLSTASICNLAAITMKERDYGFADLLYQQAIAADNNCAMAHLGLAQIMLMQKQWSIGWQEYRWRFHAHRNQKVMPWPEWQGQHCRLLVIHEQGYGDFFQCARYLHFIYMLNMEYKIFVPKDLEQITGENFGTDYTITSFDERNFDAYIYLMDLPRIFKEGINGACVTKPYMRTNLDAKIAGKTAPIVGYCWRGRTIPDPGRTIPFEIFMGLFQTDVFRQICLQQDASLYERGFFQNKNFSKDLELSTWSDTARVISSCDIIVTIDTAIAHLAGAMGKRVLCLVPYAPDWRWHFDTEIFSQASYWYPNMLLFRQLKEGDWQSVVEHVGSYLQQILSDKI